MREKKTPSTKRAGRTGEGGGRKKQHEKAFTGES